MSLSPRLTSLSLLASLLVGTTAAQGVGDPYLPGMRWSHGSQLSQAWIPRDVCFVGSHDFVWVGQAVDNPGVGLYAGSPGQSAQALLLEPLVGALGEVQVEAGDGLDELYSAAQFAVPGGQRATEVRRSSVLPGTPTWVRSLAPQVSGGVELEASADGRRLFAARFDPLAGRVHVDRLDPLDGATLQSVQLVAPALTALDLDRSGERLLVGLGSSLRLLDADLTTLLDVPLGASTEALSISGDGRALCYGQSGEARLWREVAGTWQAAETVLSPGPWLAASLDLDHTGATLGLGWWDFQTGASVLFQMWDLAGGAKLHELLQSTPGTGLQNYPEEVRVSADGRRMALGAWGSGGPDPQLLLFDRALALPLFSVYLPGSALALDLDGPGGRIAVAVKGSHANQFATTGFVQLYDLGERDLSSLGPLTSPGQFQLSSRRLGSAFSLFVFGASAAPAAFPGISGSLWVDPQQPFSVLAAPADGSGRADVAGPIPAAPGLVGFEVRCQAVFSTATGLAFSGDLVDLAIL